MKAPYPLTDSYFKTERAKAHLRELRAAVNELKASCPYSVTPQHEPERDAIRYKVVFTQPHVSIFMIAADVFQCLRTALDQAVWDLASRSDSNVEPDWTQFPVLAEDNSASRKIFRRYTRGVPAKAIVIIESFQPYHRPVGAPPSFSAIWSLHEINRIEKHRRIPVRTLGTIIERPYDFNVEITDYGCDVVCVGSNKVHEPSLIPEVVFGDKKSGITMTISDIEEMHRVIAYEILPKLASCCL
jgi:hypothetical protein